MDQDSRQSTYDRIVDTSLALFNEEGERSVSTNHIVAFLSISPGNLYYHFRNKDEIIVQLFKRYSEELLSFLSNTPLPNNVHGTVAYMTGVYDVLWRYRFLFSDVNTLLARSAELLGEHNTFTLVQVSPLLQNLLQELAHSGVMILDEIALQDLALNMWLVTKYWFDFDSSIQGRNKLTESSKVRGTKRTLSLMRPYLQSEQLQQFDAIMCSLSTDNNMVNE